MDYKEIIKERMMVLPEGLKDFVTEESWREDLKKISKEFDLDDNSYTTLENEVFLVITCFEPRSDFVQNIKDGLGIDDNTAKWIGEDVTENIFNKIHTELDSIEFRNKKPKNQTSSSRNIGNSFEQIILNQAKAMQPARLASESVAGGPAEVGEIKENNVPENLPTEQVGSEEPRVIHNYIGSDPYREPLE